MSRDGIIVNDDGVVTRRIWGFGGDPIADGVFVEIDPMRYAPGERYVQKWEGVEGALAWLAARVAVLEIPPPPAPPPPPSPEPEPRERPGYLIQTRVAELSTRIDHAAEDRIAAHYPTGRVAELEALVHQAEIKTHDGEMPTAEEIAAEEEYRRYSAYREATLSHAQGLKNAVLNATSPQLDDIEAGLEEGWPDVNG